MKVKKELTARQKTALANHKKKGTRVLAFDDERLRGRKNQTVNIALV